ncbi:snaclec 27 [Cephus cinctus]|uniref:Snaclec 27 n=1 Tax=Cephus cinctus TaxID=211228 RepID=A0AAJ7FKB3_CEPCN|nr:snaclec 27 [Cephus cinctus]
MKAILLTMYFCIVLRGTLSQFVNEDTDTEIDVLPISRVPPGYIEHGGKYYKLYTDRKTWEEALAACESDGADLAVIDSREEALYVKSLIGWSSFLEYPGVWIGFRDLGNRDWKTVGRHSESLDNTGYNTWWPRSAKLIGGCGTIKTCSRYDARDCTQLLKFICKYEI